MPPDDIFVVEDHPEGAVARPEDELLAVRKLKGPTDDLLVELSRAHGGKILT